MQFSVPLIQDPSGTILSVEISYKNNIAYCWNYWSGYLTQSIMADKIAIVLLYAILRLSDETALKTKQNWFGSVTFHSFKLLQ